METTILNRLFESICNDCGLNPESAKMKNRKTEIVLVRNIYYYFAYHSGMFSLSQIGKLVNKSHALVVHGKNKIITHIQCKDKMTRQYLTLCENNAKEIIGSTNYIENKNQALYLLTSLQNIDFSMLDAIHIIKAKSLLKKIIQYEKGKQFAA